MNHLWLEAIGSLIIAGGFLSTCWLIWAAIDPKKLRDDKERKVSAALIPLGLIITVAGYFLTGL